jgi:acetyl esterase/lipase
MILRFGLTPWLLCIASGAAALGICAVSHAQTTSPLSAPQEIRLYAAPPATQPGAAPERETTGRFYNVSEPTLLVWPAPKEKANGTAIIACPGGGYDHITMELEAQRIAQWLNPMGVTVFGLKYRTKPPSTDVAADALADGERALRLVRNNATALHINPDRVGVLGYSAGSNLILNLLCHAGPGKADSADPIERQRSKPDFAVLLSTWPNARGIEQYAIQAGGPPVFIAIAKDDRTAPPAFTAAVVARLKELNIPVQLYEAERGGHGAFHLNDRNVDEGWKPIFLDWLKQHGWMTSP